MSLGIYPVFDRTLKGTAFDALGEVLAANYEALDTIARYAGLTPLTAFADNRPILEDFDGDPDELVEILGEWTEWFNAADGHAAMQALADHIRVNPQAARGLAGPDKVVEELEELARVLTVAASENCQFRLEMS